jgi:hypothetical protein
MEHQVQPESGSNRARTRIVLGGLTVILLGMGGLFLANLWGHPPARRNIPLVDAKFLETTPWRQTYADLLKAKEDMSDYDCYGCHEKNKPPPIQFDKDHKIVIPKEHKNLVMGHGTHDRNNLCYNCHNEQNLVTLQARDGHEVKFSESPSLCGSCHGPTYRDWEAGAHGRTSGFWDHSKGDVQRLQCANCHDPHSPRIPTRTPAPAPHGLREDPAPANVTPAH